MVRVVIVILFAAWSSGATAQSQLGSALEPTRLFVVQPPLLDDNGDIAKDVSGIACLPATSARRTCLVINDEDRAAQFLTIEDNRLIGGSKLQLIGDRPSEKTVGVPPPHGNCSKGMGKFKELDGEGVAYEQPYFYVAGSHGCSRNSNRFRLSSFILARVRVDAEGRVVDKDGTSIPAVKSPNDYVESTYRLAEILSLAPTVHAFFARNLNDADGLNVEGLAVVNGKFFAGLRAPVRNGESFLVSVGVNKLFQRNQALSADDIHVMPMKLGGKQGVRDLALTGDGRILVLSGPTQEQKDVPYGLFLLDPASPSDLKFLATLKPVREGNTQGKAEAIYVLQENEDELRVLVMFDGLLNGGAREYRVPRR